MVLLKICAKCWTNEIIVLWDMGAKSKNYIYLSTKLHVKESG
jgi:hypothetical protein